MGLFPGTGFSNAPAVHFPSGEAARWVQLLARLGFAARGIVYLVVGAVALQAAITSSMDPEDSSGALLVIMRQPFGLVLLWLLLVGLAGFVIWRLVEAFRDPERKGAGVKGIATRVGFLISALLHAGLGLEAARLIAGRSRARDGEQTAEHWTGLVMAQPAGRWVIVAVGAAVVLLGLREIYHAYTAELPEQLDLSRMSHDTRRNVVRFGRLGMAARGVVFGIIGWFLVHAALRQDPTEAQGFGTALSTLQEQMYGTILLSVVAVGLFAFGLFELVEARYRVIRAR